MDGISGKGEAAGELNGCESPQRETEARAGPSFVLTDTSHPVPIIP